MRPRPPRGRVVAGTLLVVLLTVAAFLPFVLDPKSWIDRVEGFLRGLGAFGPVVYAGIVVLWMLTTVPAIPLFITGGIVYGPWEGIALSFAGAVAGVIATFWIGRLGGKRAFERLRKKHDRVAKVARLVREQGFLVVALVRLAPVFPLNLLNYGLGATRMRFRTYLIASLVVSLPGVALYAGTGAAARRFLEHGGLPWWAIAGLVVLAAGLVAATWAMRRRLRRVESGDGEEAAATSRS